jgi:Glycine zipper 2TM domain
LRKGALRRFYQAGGRSNRGFVTTAYTSCTTFVVTFIEPALNGYVYRHNGSKGTRIMMNHVLASANTDSNSAKSTGATVANAAFNAGAVAVSRAVHPLTLAASGTVILASLTAIAWMFGLIPNKAAPKVEPTTLAANSSAVGAQTIEAPKAAISPALPVSTDVIESKPVAQKEAQPDIKADPVIETAPAKPVTKPKPVVRRVAKPVAQPNDSTQAPVVGAAPSPVPNSEPYPSPAPVQVQAPSAPVTQAPALDPFAGVVTQVVAQQVQGQPSGMGAVAGGVAGGALGNQIGRGNGRVFGTIAGAVAGGLIGNSIEKSRNIVTTYKVSVRMEDGTARSFNLNNAAGYNVGDRVDVRNIKG